MSQFLSKLKTTAYERPLATVDPVETARKKLCEAIDQQIACVQALVDDADPPTKPVTRYRDGEDGQRERYEDQVRIKPWFSGDGQKWFIVPRYANKPLLDDKLAIEVGTRAKLIPALETLKKATQAGELDKQLTKARERKKK